MREIERRSFLASAIGALPLGLIAQSDTPAQAKPPRVASGLDRFGEHHVLGVSTTDFKVATRDTGGALFVMEHSNREKGGPPRHLHHNEDEWFYALEGDYLVEIGGERIQLHRGDSVLGPRGVPHAWAFNGETPGRLLIAFAPAGKMEAYFRVVLQARGAYSNPNDAQQAQLMRDYGMELMGPPLAVK